MGGKTGERCDCWKGSVWRKSVGRKRHRVQPKKEGQEPSAVNVRRGSCPNVGSSFGTRCRPQTRSVWQDSDGELYAMPDN